MKSSPEQSDDSPTPPEKSTVILLLKDIGNVTWRMFAPVIVGIALGLLADSKFDSSPWGVIVGVGVGIVTTVLLIRNIYKKL
jgi:F0F1-type ATP synthase assembly protein I